MPNGNITNRPGRRRPPPTPPGWGSHHNGHHGRKAPPPPPVGSPHNGHHGGLATDYDRPPNPAPADYERPPTPAPADYERPPTPAPEDYEMGQGQTPTPAVATPIRPKGQRSKVLLKSKINTELRKNTTYIARINRQNCEKFLSDNIDINFMLRRDPIGDNNATKLTVKTATGYEHYLFENFVTATDDGYQVSIIHRDIIGNECTETIHYGRPTNTEPEAIPPIRAPRPLNTFALDPATLQAEHHQAEDIFGTGAVIYETSRQNQGSETLYATQEDAGVLLTLERNPNSVITMTRQDCEDFLKRNANINYVFWKQPNKEKLRISVKAENPLTENP